MFNYSTSALLTCSGLETVSCLGNAGVFNVSKRVSDYYDFIILVFDLDSPSTGSLTSKELLRFLQLSVLDSRTCKIKSHYSNKIILIPVFICFETLYLYSSQLQNLLLNLSKVPQCFAKNILSVYREYYDYSKINPEVLTGIINVLPEIQNMVQMLSGQCNKKSWLPQKFHLSYTKNLLHILCMTSRVSDKIFNKHENELFAKMKNGELPIDLEQIYLGIKQNSVHNAYLAKMLFMQDIRQLELMTMENTLNTILSELDDYIAQLHSAINMKRNSDASLHKICF